MSPDPSSDIQARLEIDRRDAMPIYAQLAEQIRLLVHRGTLRPGDAMPTVRALAVDLGVNANTVARVYRDLQREGVLRLERGLGTFVADAVAGEALSSQDLEAVERKARQLVALARRSGLRAGEVKQMVDALFKEAAHVSR